MKKTIFDPISIGRLKLKNRIVRSATLQLNAADGGIVTKAETEALSSLAEGGVGLIITGMMGVGCNACVHDGMIRIYHDRFLETFSKTVDIVHEKGGTLVVQLGQCGAKAQKIDYGVHPFAPSDIEVISNLPAKAMTKDEIHRVVDEFAVAALKCREVGADGVQIHAAHGYLISEFLSPYFNKREDEYGGSIENRARFLFEVYDAIRKKVGDEYPVLVKINYTDLVEPGLTAEESFWVCKELDKRGITAIELSFGVSMDNLSKPARPGITLNTQGSFADAAVRLAADVKVPVISLGGYRSPDFIESVLNRGGVEAISMCRPLIQEPDLVKHWKKGDWEPSACISCNRCFGHPQHGCPMLTKK